jgi:hypothetical protein
MCGGHPISFSIIAINADHWAKGGFGSTADIDAASKLDCAPFDKVNHRSHGAADSISAAVASTLAFLLGPSRK